MDRYSWPKRWIVATSTSDPRSPIDAEANYRFWPDDDNGGYTGRLRVPCYGYDTGEKIPTYIVYRAQAAEGFTVLACLLELHKEHCACQRTVDLVVRYQKQLQDVQHG